MGAWLERVVVGALLLGAGLLVMLVGHNDRVGEPVFWLGVGHLAPNVTAITGAWRSSKVPAQAAPEAVPADETAKTKKHPRSNSG